ncbi:energy transducer TonB [Empedobacter sedimenti]|uniref:energy transducer TonB n=1 Tax=Empedobacter sedimenti TaxID=3042610 RepID=UPI0024A77C0C|nr:hypothetical protein [Empedobacter sedimenti]
MKNKAFLDILFENRNKEYGAYQLRQIADHDLMRSLFVGIGIVALITSGTLYANYKLTNLDLSKGDDGVVVILDDLTPTKIEEKEVVVPPKEEPPMEKKVIQLNTDQAKHIIPTPTDNPKKEETVQSVQELEKKDLGTENRDGIASTGQTGGGKVSEEGDKFGGPNTDIPEGSKEEKKPVVNPNATINSRQASVMAIYPGCESESKKGNEALTKCMSDKISKELGSELSDFAETASRNNISSAVAKMQFVINKNGEISQVKSLNGSNQDLGKEAKSALERINKQIARKGKKITPAKGQDGTDANLLFSIPVKFQTAE